jgi:CRP-like cAMP-binding protein
MEKKPLAESHIKKLAEYGLHNIPLNFCDCRRYEPGEMILREFEPISWIVLVIDGQAKVCRTAANGKTLILCYYVSDGIIGDIELMGNQCSAIASMTAISHFECVTIDYQTCLGELKVNNDFLNKLGMSLSEKLIATHSGFVAAALSSCDQRLCSYILHASYKGVFNDIMTDVSCSIGMSYRHMFRLLGQLCNEGILEKRINGYYIKRRDLLIRRAEN